MRKINSFLAIIISILLTQAIDPNYETNIEAIDHQLINKLLQNKGRSQYAKLLQREEIQPLLKLYEKNNFTKPKIDERPKLFDKEKIDILIRRSDGENIQPRIPDYTRFKPSNPFTSYQRGTIGEIDARYQSYEPRYSVEPFEEPRFVDPRVHRYRGYQSFRSPRKIPRGRELYQDVFAPSGREAFQETGNGPWKNSWRSRGPRVIFPSDLVSFRDPEQDLVLGEQNLQDLGDSEKDFERGMF